MARPPGTSELQRLGRQQHQDEVAAVFSDLPVDDQKRLLAISQELTAIFRKRLAGRSSPAIAGCTPEHGPARLLPKHTYFGALQAQEAEAAVDRCAAALAEFEAEALAAEAPSQPHPPHLNPVGGSLPSTCTDGAGSPDFPRRSLR